MMLLAVPQALDQKTHVMRCDPRVAFLVRPLPQPISELWEAVASKDVSVTDEALQHPPPPRVGSQGRPLVPGYRGDRS